MSLAGSWTVRLDSSDLILPIHLPGTLDDAGIGFRKNLADTNIHTVFAHLARKVWYTGKAYYSRKFKLPADWNGSAVQLSLERVLWRSQVYIDGVNVGGVEESLVASHIFDLTRWIKAGKEQTITIVVDNRNIYPGINTYANQYPDKESAALAHAYTNHTQTKWNGILGAIVVERIKSIAIRHLEVYSDVAARKVRFDITLSGRERYKLVVQILDVKAHGLWSKEFVKEQAGRQGGIANTDTIHGEIAIPGSARLWDEFDPRLYKMLVSVITRTDVEKDSATFGLRQLTVRDTSLILNDHRLFVRGDLECVIFPKTGYPPTSIGEWEALIRTAKSYGLNTFRFHSWCPPDAAFTAADRLGFYIHVELPHWSLEVGKDTAAFRFLRQEALRITQAYGNHPSFLFFSMGNELEGDFSLLSELVNSLRKLDPRRLYTCSSFSFQKGWVDAPQAADDLIITQWTKRGWVRGQGIFNDKAPEFAKDYSSEICDISKPIISHEIGQYSIYPDINEISQYTGNLRPDNFIAIREDLKKKGLLQLAPAFLNASGRFAAILYKEEIERALKTAGFDGFHLLQLQDYPGQGTALVGLLNAFWKSKGVIKQNEFRQFCSEVVPLIRFPKAVYSSQEIFSADVELANFYREFEAGVLTWTVRDDEGKVLAAGDLKKQHFPIGNGIPAGRISFPLNSIQRARRLTVEVSLRNTNYRNSWHFWVYPPIPVDNSKDVLITQDLDAALAGLAVGKKVLLCPGPDTLRGITGKFVPVFWSPVHFADQPGTMGQLIRKDHRALAAFPTEAYSDWQWWDLTIHSKTLDAGSLTDKAIIVRVIDNFARNKNLANLFEARMGQGRLLFCAIDITTELKDRLQARQLRYSLLEYMNSDSFHPGQTIAKSQLKAFFK